MHAMVEKRGRGWVEELERNPHMKRPLAYECQRSEIVFDLLRNVLLGDPDFRDESVYFRFEFLRLVEQIFRC